MIKEKCWLCNKIVSFSGGGEIEIPSEDICKCQEPETSSLESRMDDIVEQIMELRKLISGSKEL